MISRVIIIAALGFSFILNPSMASTQQIKRAEKELAALNQSISQLKIELLSQQQKLSKTNKQLKTLDLKIHNTQQELAKLHDKKKKLVTQIRVLNDTKVSQQKQAAKRKQQLTQLIEEQYIRSKTPVIYYFNSEQSTHQREYLRLFQQEKNQQIQFIIAELKALAETEKQLTQKNEQLSQMITIQDGEKQKLQSLRDKRQHWLNQLLAELKKTEYDLTKKQKDATALEQFIANLNHLLAQNNSQHTKDFIKNKGRLPWPIQGDIINAYGTVRTHPLTWHGELIKAPTGKSVQAIYPGLVVFADWLRGFGYLVILDHGNGFLSLYGHNQQLSKSEGQWVTQGEEVAKVGQTGSTSYPALYFEIRHQGKPQNPTDWCISQS